MKQARLKNYFHKEISQRKTSSKKLSKYVAAFDYIDKVLIVLTQQVVEYLLFRLRALMGSRRNSKCKSYFNFFSNNRNNQTITKHNKNQKEKAR